SVRVIPMGIAMGVVVLSMTLVTNAGIAMVLMVLVGALAGFFVVPMNALLQHRGHILMGAGHSIAVQNFNENLSILVMTGLYALLIASGLAVNVVIIAFGLFVAITMYFIKRLHDANQREFDSVRLLDDVKH
ncbi:MAG: lysophospholipid transporter LplT, partial [Rhodocyclaceae bacterium]